jgi:hypothetical protein
VPNLIGESDDPKVAAVTGTASQFNAIRGITTAAFDAAVVGVNEDSSDNAGPGVYGESRGTGVIGKSSTWHGVYGETDSTTGGQGVNGTGHTGVAGVGKTWVGVYGETQGSENGVAAVWADGKDGGFGVKGHAKAVGTAGVAGFHVADAGEGGQGVYGESLRNHGVRGVGQVGVSGVGRDWIGVFGETAAPAESGSAGVWGDGRATGDGVKGVANGAGKAAVCGFQLGNNGPGIFGQGTPAGMFVGDVIVTGDIKLNGADVAEDFEVSDGVVAQPGHVMVLDGVGTVRPCDAPYDRRVAGVISGAGSFQPGILLDRQDSPDPDSRRPLALVGKVYCQVDASYGAIELGDLLTTSPTPGHAMRVDDDAKASGAVLGKAMAAFGSGTGLLPILVSLQ